MPTSSLITVALISLAAIFLIVSGVRRKPSLGIILSVILIVIAARRGETSLAQMGLVQPENWLSTVLLGLLIGSGLSLLSIMLIEPLIEHITKQPHDVSVVAGVRGNWKALLSWLVVVWVVVAVGEEVLYRGFLMSQIIKLLMFGISAGWGITIPYGPLTLVLGGIDYKPGVVDGRIEIREYLYMTISFDHAIIDGAPAARFTQRLKELIENGFGLEEISAAPCEEQASQLEVHHV